MQDAERRTQDAGRRTQDAGRMRLTHRTTQCTGREHKHATSSNELNGMQEEERTRRERRVVTLTYTEGKGKENNPPYSISYYYPLILLHLTHTSPFVFHSLPASSNPIIQIVMGIVTLIIFSLTSTISIYSFLTLPLPQRPLLPLMFPPFSSCPSMLHP